VQDGPAPAAGQPPEKVEICHIPPGNPANQHTIRISESAVPAHLAHGDVLGLCPPPDGATPTVVICHRPPGNPANHHTITISSSALAAHLAHGDLQGACATQCEAVCNDGNACTVDSSGPLAAGECRCVHAPADCEDGNVCTADSCDPGVGCVYAAQVGLACDDGNACTSGETCDAQAQCAGGTQAGGCCLTDDQCDQSNPLCAPQACVETTCVVQPVTCTPPDACSAAACDPATGCVLVPVACDDGNACTVDSCDPVLGGCVGQAVPDGTACDDGDPGTAGDSCQAGLCTGG
jgi:hypothetical protein